MNAPDIFTYAAILISAFAAVPMQRVPVSAVWSMTFSGLRPLLYPVALLFAWALVALGNGLTPFHALPGVGFWFIATAYSTGERGVDYVDYLLRFFAGHLPGDPFSKALKTFHRQFLFGRMATVGLSAFGLVNTSLGTQGAWAPLLASALLFVAIGGVTYWQGRRVNAQLAGLQDGAVERINSWFSPRPPQVIVFTGATNRDKVERVLGLVAELEARGFPTLLVNKVAALASEYERTKATFSCTAARIEALDDLAVSTVSAIIFPCEAVTNAHMLRFNQFAQILDMRSASAEEWQNGAHTMRAYDAIIVEGSMRAQAAADLYPELADRFLICSPVETEGNTRHGGSQSLRELVLAVAKRKQESIREGTV